MQTTRAHIACSCERSARKDNNSFHELGINQTEMPFLRDVEVVLGLTRMRHGSNLRSNLAHVADTSRDPPGIPTLLPSSAGVLLMFFLSRLALTFRPRNFDESCHPLVSLFIQTLPEVLTQIARLCALYSSGTYRRSRRQIATVKLPGLSENARVTA